MSQETMKMVYLPIFIISQIIVLEGTPHIEQKIFKIQKKLIQSRTHADFFKNLKILPLHSQHILSPLLFLVKNENEFKLNCDVYKHKY